MAKRTKKAGPVGRFGPRYGTRDRVRFRDVENRQKKDHSCPSCGHATVRRESTAVWLCRKCGAKFAGGAYYPRTDAALGVEKAIQGVVEKLKAVEADKGA